MSYEKKHNSLFVLTLFLIGLFAVSVVSAMPETGIGDADLDVKSVHTGNNNTTYVFTITNDGTTCIDELFICAPGTWGGNASVNYTSNLGPSDNIDNRLPGTYTDARGWDQATPDHPSFAGNPTTPNELCVRIQVAKERDNNNDAYDGFCPWQTADIYVTGWEAPADEEYADFGLWTSVLNDLNANEEVDNSDYDGNDNQNELQVSVTEARNLEIHYLSIDRDDYDKFVSGGAADDPLLIFSVEAFGADARLDELILSSNVAGAVDIYWKDTLSGVCSGELVADNVAVTGGLMDLADLDNGLNEAFFGFTPDSPNGAKDYYCIVDATGTATLEVDIWDYTEEIREIVEGTYLEDHGAEGTLLTVDNFDASCGTQADRREILVQTVDADGHVWPPFGEVSDVSILLEHSSGLYMPELDDYCQLGWEIPHVDAEADCGFVRDIVYKTEEETGQEVLEVCVGKKYGAFEVNIWAHVMDEEGVEQVVGFDSGVATAAEEYYENPVLVNMPMPEEVGVVIYDQYWNIITDTDEHLCNVDFEYVQNPDLTNPACEFSDNFGISLQGSGPTCLEPTTTGPDDNFDTMGKATVFVHPYESTENLVLGDNVVHATYDCIADTTEIVVQAINDDGDKILLECPSQIKAGEEHQIKITMTDKNGNALPEWKSLVDVKIMGEDRFRDLPRLRAWDNQYNDFVECGCDNFWRYDGCLQGDWEWELLCEEEELDPFFTWTDLLDEPAGDQDLIGYTANNSSMARANFTGFKAQNISIWVDSDTLKDAHCDIIVRHSEPVACEIVPLCQIKSCVGEWNLVSGDYGSEYVCNEWGFVDTYDAELCAKLGYFDEELEFYVERVDEFGNPIGFQLDNYDQDTTGHLTVTDDCGTFSTEAVAISGETGVSPLVSFYREKGQCACTENGDGGSLTINWTEDNLTQFCQGTCHPNPFLSCTLDVTLEGLPFHIDTSVEPYNEDWNVVSELMVLDLWAEDACGNVIDWYDGTVDVEIANQDCVDLDIQVSEGQEVLLTTDNYTNVTECRLDENDPVYKVVFDNCGEPEKDWIADPELNDILVDKVAFSAEVPDENAENLYVEVWVETEKLSGFQRYGLVGDMRVANQRLVDLEKDIYGNYLIEIDDRLTTDYPEYNWDNQRLGGILLKAGDWTDVYFVLRHGNESGNESCGNYSMEFKYFQDYSGPDIVYWNYAGEVRDGETGWDADRNSDWEFDPYPDFDTPTERYGFGDVVLKRLTFSDGHAYMKFTDLTSELVDVWITNVVPSIVGVEDRLLEHLHVPAWPEHHQVEFLEQPATQVIALNHGDLCNEIPLQNPNSYPCERCGPEGCYPSGCDMFYDSSINPVQACSDEGYDINLQVADGFQNDVPLRNIEVHLSSCMLWPTLLIGEELVDLSIIAGDINTVLELDDNDFDGSIRDPTEDCVDLEKLFWVLREVEDSYFDDVVNGGDEVGELILELFQNKEVKFYETGTQGQCAGNEITKVTTDANGQATFRIESDDASFFGLGILDAKFRIFTTPYGLDADYFDVAFRPGAPTQFDIIPVPADGIPADGEEEALLFIRKLDACENPVPVFESVTVSTTGNAVISQNFNGQNNYDNQVEGFVGFGCLLPWFDDCSLTVLNDVPETVEVTVAPTGQSTQTPDTETIDFVGAPVKLKITSIEHSDLLPADGWIYDQETVQLEGQDILPIDICPFTHTFDPFLQQQDLPDECRYYGNTGGWVNIEIQDKKDKLVRGYLGDGFRYDPGDQDGAPDYLAEGICVFIDDQNAWIDDWKFGVVNLIEVDNGVWCFDLAFGKGAVHIVYDGESAPDEIASVPVEFKVFDLCDPSWEPLFGSHPGQDNLIDDYCNGQEYNEDNLPDSEGSTRLEWDEGQLDFVHPATKWEISADKQLVKADGQDFATITVQARNEYFKVRQRLEATLQSSLEGTVLESEAFSQGCAHDQGTFDPLNPTSLIVDIPECNSGAQDVKITSTVPGVTEVTVSGFGFGCKTYLSNAPSLISRPMCIEWGITPLIPANIEIEFSEVFMNEINLEPGWNFISTPYELSDPDAQDVFAGITTVGASFFWDDGAQTFGVVQPTTNVEPLEGYWVFVDEAQTLVLDPFVFPAGAVLIPPSKDVFAGWNDVGLSFRADVVAENALQSVDDVYTTLYDWDEMFQTYAYPVTNNKVPGGGTGDFVTGTFDMKPGQGYFIFATGDDTLAGLST